MALAKWGRRESGSIECRPGFLESVGFGEGVTDLFAGKATCSKLKV